MQPSNSLRLKQAERETRINFLRNGIRPQNMWTRSCRYIYTHMLYTSVIYPRGAWCIYNVTVMSRVLCMRIEKKGG